MSHASDLIQRSDHIFKGKQCVDNLWQSIAMHFYPQRAHFTIKAWSGDEFADHLVSSYPPLVQRRLSEQIAGMLRKDEWFQIGVKGGKADHRGKQWLSSRTEIQRNHLYANGSNFVRSTKEGDADFTAFGQTALTGQYDLRQRNVIWQCWHLRDCAWSEDYAGQICEITRKWECEANKAVALWGKDKVHQKVREAAEDPKRAFEKFHFRHMIIPPYEYNKGGKDPMRKTWWSVWIDVSNEHIIEEIELRNRMYVIPRWQTASGSPYAHSPATIIGLPDARLIQDMNRILLEAGERSVDPPLIATREAVRGDIQDYAGGVTWVDHDYDERTGASLRPMGVDRHGLPLGLEMEKNIQNMLAECFYLNTLTLPPIGTDMTAYETSERIKEWTRQALPLFQPMEEEYNKGLCQLEFDLLMDAGHFGPSADIPRSLVGSEVEFDFNSPIRDASGREDAMRYREIAGLLAEAAQVDQGLTAEVDITKAFRTAVEGLGGVEWLADPEDAAEARRRQAEMAMAAQMAAA